MSVGLAAPAAAQDALPSGGSVVAGSADISTVGGAGLAIDQSSSHAIIDWSSFSIGSGNSVDFANGGGATLNRVTGTSVSAIDGRLSATGSVYLINNNGVIIGENGVVDVGGSFVASTLDLTDADFLNGGDTTFAGASDALVINYGKIGALGGDVALIAARVENHGAIDAPNGAAALAAGYEVLMRDAALADGKFVVKVGGPDTSATNAGAIRAAEAELRANGGDVLALAGNTDGVIRAAGVAAHGGRIFLTAPDGKVAVGGDVFAKGPASDDGAAGGEVYISADVVAHAGAIDVAGDRGGQGGLAVIEGRDIDLASGSVIDASGASGGTILVGGDYQGGVNPENNFHAAPIVNAEVVSVADGATLSADGADGGNGGDVVVWSDARTDFAGMITARGGPAGGDGGFAEVSSKGVLSYTGLADLSAANGAFGTLLLDPYNVFLKNDTTSNGSLSNGVFTPSGDDSVFKISDLVTALGSANVEIVTTGAGSQDGDITVVDAITWTDPTTLTLTALGDVFINGAVTATNGGLVVDAAGTATATAAIDVGSFSLLDGDWSQTTSATVTTLPDFHAGDFYITGGSFLRVAGGAGTSASPYLVTDVYGLQGVGTSSAFRAAEWQLANDIDASGTAGWNDGAGFDPIGDSSFVGLVSGAFEGDFDGAGHVISDLFINRPLTDDVGLFGAAFGGAVSNVGLIGGSIRGDDYVGGLVGYLIGSGGGVTQSYATATINGDDSVGGLVGYLSSSGAVTQSYATGAVMGSTNVGGLVGNNYYYGIISEAYATGAVSGTQYVGGLVGANGESGSITKAYATGAVTGSSNVGGLVGSHGYGAISDAYASGLVTGSTFVGGLIGSAVGATTTNSYWDKGTTGQTVSAAGVGLTTAEARTASNFSNWSIDTTPGDSVSATADWLMINGETRPFGAWEFSTTITNVHQLQLMNFDLDASYTLGAHIDARQTAGANPSGMWTTAGFDPIGDFTNAFTGSFDGGGHTISNLFIDRLSSDLYIGLFGNVNGGTISNVGLVGGSVSGYEYVGALVGNNHNGVISQVYATTAVSGHSSGSSVGGLVGRNVSNGAISKAYAIGPVSGGTYVGGLVGLNGLGTIAKAYALGAVDGSSHVGGLVGSNGSNAAVTNSYAAGAVTGSSNVGGLVGSSDFLTVSSSYWDKGTTGQTSSAGGGAGLTTAEARTASSYSGWSIGTTPGSTVPTGNWLMIDGETRPFGAWEYSTEIINLHQLQLMTFDLDADYAVMMDIDAGRTAEANSSDMWTTDGFNPIGDFTNAFTGSFDGGGHTISNLFIDRSTTDHVGLFGRVQNGNISHVGLIGGSVTGEDGVGALVGYSTGSTITDAYATGDVSGGDEVGGLVGYNGTASTITQAYATGAVSGDSGVGGLVGWKNNSTITQSYATGAVSGTGSRVGGLVGSSTNKSIILQSYAAGAVSGTQHVGGLVGRSSNTAIEQSYATGAVSGTSSRVGGLVGYSGGGTITQAYAAGAVTGTSHVGGLVGQSVSSSSIPDDGAITQAFATGSVTGTSTSNVGGLVGSSNRDIVSDSHWDTGTTGQSTSAGGGSGLTTAQLQAALQTGFDSSVWGVTAGVAYPYFKWRFPDGPSVISGVVSGVTGGVKALGVNVAAAGEIIGSIHTGADGYYYLAVDPLGDTPILSWLDGARHAATDTSEYGNALAMTSSGHAAGLDINAGWIRVASDLATFSGVQTDLMAAAKGSLTDSEILYTVNSALTIDTGVDFHLDAANASFAIDTALSTTGAIWILGEDDLTINSGALITTTATGDSIVLSAIGDFINNSGASALSATNGRWLVYSDAPADNTFGGLDSENFAVWNATFASLAPGSVTQTGDRYLFAKQPMLTVTTTNGSKTYGALGDVSGNYAISTTYEAGVANAFLADTEESVDVTGAPSVTSLGTPTTADVGSYTISGALGSSLASGGRYGFTFVDSGKLTVNKATLTVGLQGTVSKIYDGSTGATLGSTNYTLSGLLNGDTVLLNSPTSGSYGDKNAGSGKNVTVTGLSISGDDVGNYTLSSTSATGAIGTITAKSVTASLTGTLSKTYDGTTTATLGSPNYTISGVLAGDTVNLDNPTGHYNNKNVGGGKTVTFSSLTLDGTDAGNYALSSTSLSGAIGKIEAKSLTATAVDASKTYDGVSYSGGNGVTYSGFVTGENETVSGVLGGSLSYGGTAQGAVNAGDYTITPQGLNAANYDITYASGKLTIDKAELTITPVDASKTYDGLSYSISSTHSVDYSGFVNGDDEDSVLTGAVSFGGTAQGAVNAGDYTITVTGKNDASGNYDIKYAPGALTIDPATLTVTANAASKVYGAVDPTLTYGVDGLVGSDTAASVLSGSLTRATGESVSGGPYAISKGTLVSTSNYDIDYTGANFTISPKTLTASLTGTLSKTYDGTTAATLGLANYTLSGVLTGDTVGLGNPTGSYDSKNVGSGKTVTFSSLTLDGTDAGNYALSSTSLTGAIGTITQASLTITPVDASKTYDGLAYSIGSTHNVTYSGFVNGEDESVLTGSLLFAGTAQGAVSAGDYAITVTGKADPLGNYAITYLPGALTVGTATLTVTADALSKVYGAVDPTLTYGVDGLKGSDTAASVLSGSLTRATGESVSGGPYAIGKGTLVSNSNYEIDYTGANFTITRKPLTVGLTGSVSKIYDGSTGATLGSTNYTLSGLLNGDTVLLNSPTSGSYGDKNAGSGKNVTVTGLSISGDDVGNYALSSTSATGAIGTITAKSVTASLTGTLSKIYDGTTTATLGSPNYTLSGVLAGDTVNLDNPTGHYNNKNVGGGKTVSFSGLTLGGTHGSNYALSSTSLSGAIGKIEAKSLTVTAVDASKTYDGVSYSGGNGVTYSGFVTGENETVSGVLGGSLSYGGTAQGAVNAGDYTITPQGLNAANYDITYASGKLTIDKATVTARLTGSVSKTYDGSTNATLGSTNYTLSGVISGDTVLLNNPTSGSYDDKNVGAGKDVTVTGLSISGDDVGNYVLGSASVTGAVGTITAKSVTASLTGTLSKIYDGTTTASLGSANYTLSGVLTGDTVTLDDPTGSYASKDAGEDKQVSFSNMTLGGADRGNYALSSTSLSGAIGKITAKPLTASLTGTVSKVYDGTTAATLGSANYTLSGIVAGDTVTLDNPTGSYNNKNVGNGKTVTFSSLTLGGTDASNYALSSTSLTGAIGTIIQAELIAAATPASRIYGDANPTLSGTITGWKNGESASDFGGETWTTTAAAASDVGAYAITGGLVSTPSNYTLTQAGTNTTALTITEAELIATATPASRIYGDDNPVLSGEITGWKNSQSAVDFGGATWTTTASAASNVGAYGINGGLGSTPSNYTLTQAAGNATALTVDKATLTATANTVSRTYGDVIPTLSGSITGWKNSQSAVDFGGVTWTTTASAGPDVGSYGINGALGAAADNYTLNQATGNATALTIGAATLRVTADAQSKVYGDSNPTLTYAVSGYKLTDDSSILSGALTRETGESVSGGPYAITQGTLAANANYTIDYTGADFTITPATLTVTADALSKVYGQGDPALTYAVYGFKLMDVAGKVLSGSLTRAAGESVAGGPYAIGQGTLAANSNYRIEYAGADFTITPATLTVTANALTKVYGDSDPTLTYGVTGFEWADDASILSGALARETGETVAGGPYAIGQGSLAANANYRIDYTGADFAITPATLTVTADALSKVYGAVDPTLTYGVTGFEWTDDASILSGALTRAAGETVAGGPYAIAQGSLAANANYRIEYAGANFVIAPATLTVTADALSKVYGDIDPTLTYGVSGFERADDASILSGALARETGETVAGGPYAIGQGSLAANANYRIEYAGADFTIAPATLTVTADALSKVYGDIDPTLTYGVSGFKSTDDASILSGELTRAIGESVAGGPYAIGQGSLAANSNYRIDYAGADFTIAPATLTVTADALSKVYGDIDPTLTYGVSGFKSTDDASILTGALMRAIGESVAGGPYAIGQGSLATNANYTIDYIGADFAITPATLTARLTGAVSKVYDGTTTAPLHAGHYALAGVIGDDAVRLSAPSSGAYNNSDAGDDKTVSAAGLSIWGADAGNYVLASNSITGAVGTITPRPITVAAHDKSMLEGEVDPQLTYQMIAGEMVDGDALTGRLVRQPGAAAGAYSIQQGTLTADGNYMLTFVDGTLTIRPAPRIDRPFQGADVAAPYQGADTTGRVYFFSTVSNTPTIAKPDEASDEGDGLPDVRACGAPGVAETCRNRPHPGNMDLPPYVSYSAR